MELISFEFRNFFYLFLFLVNGCSGFFPLQANEPTGLNPVGAPQEPVKNVLIKVHRNSYVFDFKKDNEAMRQELISQVKPKALDETIKLIKSGNENEMRAVISVDGEVPYNSVNLLLNTLKSNGVRKISVNITTN